MTRAKKNPAALPPMEAAEDLWAQFNKVGGRLFDLFEVKEFVEYCMAALQRCPESARSFVDASWTMSRMVAGERIYAQRVELSDGKVNALIETHHDFLPSAVVPAHVDLESMWASFFQGTFNEDAKISLVTFVQEMHDESFKQRHGAGATRSEGPEQENAHFAEIIRLQSPEEIERWCNASMKAFVYYDKPTYAPEGEPQRGVVLFGQNHFGANREVISVGLIMRYAALIERLCTIADELLEAGWQPEHESYVRRGKLCTWTFTDLEHPANQK